MDTDHRIRVLFLAANPEDQGQLDLQAEVVKIMEKTTSPSQRFSLDLIPCLAAKPEDLIQKFTEIRPHIVHFSGHGDEVNQIFLENHDGKAHPVSEEALERLFTVMKENIRLVVLNACFAGSQAKVIAKTIEATIGMKVAVGDVRRFILARRFIGRSALGSRCFKRSRRHSWS